MILGAGRNRHWVGRGGARSPPALEEAVRTLSSVISAPALYPAMSCMDGESAIASAKPFVGLYTTVLAVSVNPQGSTAGIANGHVLWSAEDRG